MRVVELNRLANNKHLARISGTPGKTRSINYYRAGDLCFLVDLPGYGYAKVSREMRNNWQAMVEDYLTGRKQLKAAVLIQDLRRPPGPEERDLLAWLSGRGIPFLLVATKADKLGRSERHRALLALGQGLGLGPDQITPFSATTREGRDELWKRLLKWLG